MIELDKVGYLILDYTSVEQYQRKKEKGRKRREESCYNERDFVLLRES